MADQATAKYLNDNIGTVLAKALAEMSVAQPNNGVDFLAQWLKTYAEQEEAKEAREKAEKQLENERAKTKAKLEEKDAAAKAAAAEAATKTEMYDSLMTTFGSPDTTFGDELWTKLVDVAKTLTGASAVYLGMVDEEGLEGQPGPLIVYDRATAGSEWMTEKCLQQGKGVTWGAVTENPGEEVPCLWKPPMPETPPVDPDGEAPPEEKPGMSYFPVAIPCVTDVKEVHYFDLTRLGSYLAVPLVYTSYYTAEALAGAKTYEEEKLAAAKAREEALAAAEAAAAEAVAAGTEAEEKPPEEPVEEKPMVLQGKTVKMVLCIDTLGTNVSIEDSKIIPALMLCTSCGKCKEATEMKQVDQQALKDIDAELRAKLDEEIAAARTQVEEELKENMEEAEAACASDEEAKKDLIQKEYAYLRACHAAAKLKTMVLELTAWVVVPPEMLSIVAALAYTYGYSKESLYAKGKTALQWDKLRTILDEKFFAAISTAQMAGVRKGLIVEHKLASIKAMLPAEFDEEKAKAINPAFEVLWTLLQTAITFRTTDLNFRKEEYSKKKEEEGEAFEGPPLEELDDDFAE